ncbi:MAG: protein-disulfide reductase DsbD family protein [Fimbriimonadaceae bacterium]|nr:protein-disulfide reductase DsbD family protein [Fimbriimonadaceae bacterium]
MMFPAALALLMTQNHAQAAWTPAVAVVAPNAVVDTILEIKLDPDWHTYWWNAGDNGAPPQFKWTLPTGWKLVGTSLGVPEIIELDGMTSYGYENVMPVLAQFKAPAAPGRHTLRGTITVLVCESVCRAETLNVSTTVEVRPNPPASPRRALPVIPRSVAGWRASAALRTDRIELDVRGTVPDGLDLSKVQFLAETKNAMDYASGATVTAIDGGLRVSFAKSPFWQSNLRELRGLLIAPTGTKWPNGVNAAVVQASISQ